MQRYISETKALGSDSGWCRVTVAVIVQARYGSSRLPGKVMMKLDGQTVLSHVVARCKRITHADVVCVATTESSQDDRVAHEAASCGAFVFRGSVNDVLTRYFRAAKHLAADIVLRVTCDCPLLDPDIANGMVQICGERTVDYVSNNLPPTWPHGLDCEAFTMEALARCNRETRILTDREHVTPWLRTNDSVRKVNMACPEIGLEKHRWTLDYREDLEFFRQLSAILSKPLVAVSWQDCLAAVQQHKEFCQINSGRVDALRLEQRAKERDTDDISV